MDTRGIYGSDTLDYGSCTPPVVAYCSIINSTRSFHPSSINYNNSFSWSTAMIILKQCTSIIVLGFFGALVYLFLKAAIKAIWSKYVN
jgi:hypothetical protein